MHRVQAGTRRAVGKLSVCYPDPVVTLFWRAANETVRELGLNVPTAVSVVLVIGFTIIFDRTFADPETDSVTDFELWLIKSMAWLLAVVVVFVLHLTWNTFKVVRQDRTTIEYLRLAAESTTLVDDQMKSYLHNALRDRRYGVAKCYAFGSVVGQYPTRDVDIIIQFDSSKRHRVRTYRHRLRDIESSFHEFYGLKLHVQMFLSTENEALHRFLNDAGQHERIK